MRARFSSVERTLRGFGPFADLSAGTLAELSSGARAQRLPRGAQLWREGGPAGELFLLSHGLVSIHQTGVERAKIVVDFGGPGDLLGAPGGALAHGAAASVVSPHAQAIVLDAETLSGAARRDEALQGALAARAARAPNRLERKLRAVSAGLPSARLATALLGLANRYGRAGEGSIVLPFAPPASELGAFADLPRALATELLERWASWELVYVYDEALVIRAPKALASLSNGGRLDAGLSQSGVMPRAVLSTTPAGAAPLASAG